LTTFIDHRPPPGQGSVRTNDRSWVRSIHDGLLTCSSPPSHTRYCLLRNKGDSRPSIRQKGARRSSGQDRKDQGDVGGFRPTPPKYKPEDRSLSKPATPGDTDATGLSKPFVEPLFTCQRTSKRQAVSK
jgi:hypothetical protein